MRIQTLALLCVLGMGTASFSVYQLTDDVPEQATDPVASVDAPPGAVDAPPEPPDRSHFVAGQTLMLDGRLGHARVAANQPQSTFLLATITGEAGATAPAAPLDLTIVIDTSGSMRGDRMRNAVEGAIGMIDRMRSQDRVSVVTYSSQANLLVPATSMDPFTRDRVAAQLRNIRPQGDTCISCALDLAMRSTVSTPGRVSRILLLSDGEATLGVQDELGFRAIADRCRTMGTPVSTIGVDVEYNAATMGALAQFSNGRHYFVENPSQLPPVFEQELQSLSRSLANDVQLVVDLADGVQVERIFDRAVTRQGNQLIVPIGAVAPGEEATFLVGLRLPAGASPEQEAASMRLTYQDLQSGTRGECGGELAARTVDDPALVSQLDPFVSARLSRSVTAQGLREANEAAERGDFAGARRRLAETRQEVSLNRQAAMVVAEPAAAEEVGEAFGEQEAALDRAGGGFSGAGLEAPAMSPVGRAARRRARSQARSNQADLVNPFSR